MIQIDRNRKIHGRQVQITTYEYEKDSVVVEGRLTDNRFMKTYYFSSGESRPPGVVHDLVIRMVVKGPKLVIDDIDVDMETVPREDCREVLNTLKRVIGMKIRAGFTEKVKEKIGGAKGCTHLVALLLAMAPAAVQGAWSAVARHPVDPAKYSGAALKFLENTCWVWRADGELMQETREKLSM
ncbi:MAG: DUF2889 domain-containing protein [Desulfobacteraceae bacterium]|nr:DUF2889 domain-containing protein [Desulfobacteraceae bacterium]MBC2755600.1 DUF2889 domain-containing protein [Desulfobacteraceae bacterium]